MKPRNYKWCQNTLTSINIFLKNIFAAHRTSQLEANCPGPLLEKGLTAKICISFQFPVIGRKEIYWTIVCISPLGLPTHIQTSPHNHTSSVQSKTSPTCSIALWSRSYYISPNWPNPIDLKFFIENIFIGFSFLWEVEFLLMSSRVRVRYFLGRVSGQIGS